MEENRLKWAGNVERMAEDHMTKRADADRSRERREDKRKTAIEMGGPREKS